VHEASRSDLPTPLAVSDYLKIARDALERKDYQVAFLNFHAFWLRNTEDMRGPLFCGQVKVLTKEYDQAMYFLREASALENEDIRIPWAIIQCHRAMLQAQFSAPYYAQDAELKEIVIPFAKFRQAIAENKWQELPQYADFLNLLLSMGVAANTEEELEQNVKTYLGMLTSAPCVVYAHFLQVDSVYTNGQIAIMELSDGEKILDKVYLKKIGNQWKIVIFLESLFQNDQVEFHYQDKNPLELAKAIFPLDYGKLYLMAQTKAIWEWQASQRQAKPETLAAPIQKKLQLLDQLKKRMPGLFEGKFTDAVAKKIASSLQAHLEKVQVNETIYTQVDVPSLMAGWEKHKKDSIAEMGSANTYGLPPDLWKKCSYYIRGIWMLDMTTTAWESLSLADQKTHALFYRQAYARLIQKSPEENFIREGVTFIMVLVPPGRYWMGSPPDEASRKSDERRFKAVLPSPFYIGKHEVTQQQWQTITGYNPSHFKGEQLPVEQVSWYDCQRFCNKIGMRLPTEAEWEYACRAGTTTPFNLGNEISPLQANYNGNYPYLGFETGLYREKTIPIGELFNGNAWRIYDFHGNVWEWCWDWYGDYPLNEQINPTGGATELQRVSRGGGWSAYASVCRSADRSKNEPGFRFIYLGFRVAKSLE